MGKRKHRKSKSSPGFIGGKRGNSFDSIIEESSSEHEEEQESKLDPPSILKIQNTVAESSQLGVNSVNLTEEGDDYPIFNPSIPLPLPISFSHSSSSCNSSISLRLPSSNVSLASHSPSKKNSRSCDGAMDHTDSDSENDEQITFPVSDVSQSQQESFLGHMRSLNKSPPPIQAMDRSGEGYDPHRIPAAVFETNKTEWSVASNESLFSLHLGRTNSLSPENMYSWGGDMTKSGELDSMAVQRLAGPRASVSDCGQWFHISDVEFDHVLKKIEEHGVTDSDEEETSYQENEKKNKVRLNQTEDYLKQVDSEEASLRNGDLKIATVVKGSKNSEESIKSTYSFAFDQLLADGKKPKHSSSIQMQQHEPASEPAAKKSRLKSWFYCCSFSSCFLGSCSCSFCSCSSFWPSSECSWCGFCCFRTPRLGGNRFLCC